MNLLFNGNSFSVWDDGKVSKMDDDKLHNNINIPSESLNYCVKCYVYSTLKSVLRKWMEEDISLL